MSQQLSPKVKVNGVLTSFCNMQVTLNTTYAPMSLSLIDVKSIDYESEVEMKFHRMSSSFPVARFGRWTGAKGSIELGIETHRALLDNLGTLELGGYTDTPFNVSLIYQLHPGSAFLVDTLHDVRLMGAGQKNTLGGKHLSTSSPLSISWIDWNGAQATAAIGPR